MSVKGQYVHIVDTTSFSELTCHIGAAMAGISIQIIVGEAGPGHEPRSLSNDLGIIAIRVTIDTVEHFSIAKVPLF